VQHQWLVIGIDWDHVADIMQLSSYEGKPRLTEVISQ
jgi:hypothetical protein